MKDRIFDENIKRTLENLEIKTKGNWSEFEKILDASEVLDNIELDNQVDSIIQNKIQHHEVHFIDNQWSKLKRMLDAEDATRKRIYFAKALEAAILLLLISSIYQMRHFAFPNESNTAKYAQHSEAILESELALENQSFEEDISVNTGQNKQLSIIETPNAQDVISSGEVIHSMVPHRSNNNNLRLDQQTLTAVGLATQGNYSIVSYPPTIPSTFAELDSPKTEDLAIISIPTNRILNIDTLPSLDNHVIFDQGMPILPVNAWVSDVNGPDKYLSIGLAADANLINTPIDFELFRNPRHTGALGATLSLAYSVRTKNNEFQTGINYAYKTYNPALIEKFGSSTTSVYETRFDRIQFHVIQLPFLYKRYIASGKSWNAYAMIGASLNFLAVANYDVQNNLKSGVPRPSLIQKSSRINNKDFTEGLLQGGFIQENAFLTGSLGLGFQRLLSINSAFYMQTHYQQHLFSKSLGPNKDKLNSFSVEMGMRIKI